MINADDDPRHRLGRGRHRRGCRWSRPRPFWIAIAAAYRARAEEISEELDKLGWKSATTSTSCARAPA